MRECMESEIDQLIKIMDNINCQLYRLNDSNDKLVVLFDKADLNRVSGSVKRSIKEYGEYATSLSAVMEKFSVLCGKLGVE